MNLTSAFSAALPFLGAIQERDFNREAASTANAFSERMASTQHQREVADLKAAGLNPMLSLRNGGAAAPSGASFSVDNPGGASASAFQQARLNTANIANIEADTENKKISSENIQADTFLKRVNAGLSQSQTLLAGASADQARANISMLETQAKKIAEEIKNVPKEGDRLSALARQLSSYDNFLQKQSITEVQRAQQMKWLALKTMLESDLTNKDLEAAVESGNFGRLSHEYRYVVDVLKDFIPNFNIGKVLGKKVPKTVKE